MFNPDKAPTIESKNAIAKLQEGEQNMEGSMADIFRSITDAAQEKSAL